MKVAFFDTHRFDRAVFEQMNAELPQPHTIRYFEPRLSPETALLANGYDAVCVFVNDRLDEEVIQLIAPLGVRLVALRSAGYNNVDLRAAHAAGIKVARVPAYSPHAVAEHALCLLMALNRKVYRAYQRVREMNFSLDGLVGFDVYGKTVGVVGVGTIGSVFCRIMHGLGAHVLVHDLAENEELKRSVPVEFVSLDELYRRSDVISLHVPLNKSTRHMINEEALAKMKPGVILINTGRGALIDSRALIQGLKTGHIGGAGLDVYEEEEGLFFQDLSGEVLQDDLLARLLTFPNVVITAHQAFLTREALQNIAQTTLDNLTDFEQGRPLKNEVKPEA